ncbi:Hpt domain-containing protein [Pseudokordiimonas caeni]|uniref:Hpt domain-containing protein n=1 Tax=Pseudokordiimonas caeni TaxID=2997908 RepID=UPI002811A3BC|nr:Hpt domain-containing protein [Pseudokordiimonas caeni]
MMTDVPTFDPDPFERIKADVGEETARVLMASFRAEVEDALEALFAHHDGGNWALLDVESHALKSTARTFGALALGEAAEQVEKEAESGAVSEEAMAALREAIIATLEATG